MTGMARQMLVRRIRQARPTLGAVPPAVGHPVDGAHQEYAHQHARDNPAEKQAADRHAGDPPVDDEGNARRDHRPDGRGGPHQRGREGLRVAGALHRGNEEGAGSRRVRHRRSRHPGHDHVGHDGHMAEPAADPSNQRLRQVDQSLRDAAAVHELAGQKEKRDGQQHERVHPDRDPLGHNHQRDAALWRGCRRRRRRSWQRRRETPAQGVGGGRPPGSASGPLRIFRLHRHRHAMTTGWPRA